MGITIPIKTRLYIVESTVDFALIQFIRATTFVSIFISFNKSVSKHIVYLFVMP